MKVRNILIVALVLAIGFGIAMAEDQMIIKLHSGDQVTYLLTDVDTIKFSQIFLDSGLVAYYPFNGNTNDVSGNHLDGENHGATLTADRAGRANRAYHFTLDSSSYIGVADNDLLDIGADQDFAISLWMRTSRTDTAMTLLAKYSGNFGPEMNIIRDGRAQFWGRDPNACPVDTGLRSHVAFTDGRWHHWVGMRRGTVWSFWLDGVKEIAIDAGRSGPLGNEMELDIGCQKYGGNDRDEFFHGDMDEVRFYRRALSDAEIQLLSRQ